MKLNFLKFCQPILLKSLYKIEKKLADLSFAVNVAVNRQEDCGNTILCLASKICIDERELGNIFEVQSCQSWCRVTLILSVV